MITVLHRGGSLNDCSVFAMNLGGASVSEYHIRRIDYTFEYLFHAGKLRLFVKKIIATERAKFMCYSLLHLFPQNILPP